ncbi:hypothetical protein PTKIN_Ptkin11bG0118300 [Pterospermum kingtungense]
MRRIAYTCWFIWKCRPEVVVAGISLNVDTVARHLIDAVSEFETFYIGRRNRICVYNSVDTVVPDKWVVTNEGRVTINVDEAWDSRNGLAGIGIIVRNERGVAESALISKALAYRKGLKLAVSKNFGKVDVEMDCEVLFGYLRDKVVNKDWKLRILLEDIVYLQNSIEDCRFKLVRRLANKAIDWVTTQSREKMCPKD